MFKLKQLNNNKLVSFSKLDNQQCEHESEMIRFPTPFPTRLLAKEDFEERESKEFKKILQITGTKKQQWKPISQCKRIMQMENDKHLHSKSGLRTMKLKYTPCSELGTILRWKDNDQNNSVIITGDGEMYVIHCNKFSKLSFSNSEILKRLVRLFGPCDAILPDYENLTTQHVKLPLLIPTSNRKTRIEEEEEKIDIENQKFMHSKGRHQLFFDNI